METLNKISAGLEKVTGYFLIFAFASMTVVYFSSVVMRYVFNNGLMWADEFTRYMNIALVMLGSATIARHNDHTNISVLELTVNSKVRKWVVMIQQILTTIFFLCAAAIGFNFAKTAYHVSANMKIPMGFLYNVMSVAFVLLAFQAVTSILNLIKEKEE
ncbi:MAG: TRAP dicarboxylate transporter [Clostridiales bacterium 38_11]|nr:MAG: TRAP dicarboxylate transporter [Clostridiales bacterium 38_11]HBH13074.1 hypothetical protein [Clostridiales bacterium]